MIQKANDRQAQIQEQNPEDWKHISELSFSI